MGADPVLCVVAIGLATVLKQICSMYICTFLYGICFLATIGPSALQVSQGPGMSLRSLQATFALVVMLAICNMLRLNILL